MVSTTPTAHVLTRGDRPPEEGPEAPQPGLVSRASGRWGRLALVGIGCLAAAFAFLRQPGVPHGDRRVATVALLRERGFVAQADDVVFVDGPSGLIRSTYRRARVLVRASRSGSDDTVEGELPTDIYLFEARLTPSGALLDLEGGYNLSDTTGADETRPVVSGERVIYASNSGIENAPSVVTVLDLSGQAKLDWPLFARAQNALTNYQLTGQLQGVGRSTFVVAGDGEVSVRTATGEVVVQTGERSATLIAVNGAWADLPGWIEGQPGEIAPPGNLTTWSVDRVRHEIGDENMQAIKQAWFEAKNFFIQHSGEVSGTEVAADIAEEMGEELGPPKRDIPIDLESGWPPPPLELVVTPHLDGEGQWNAKEDDAFYRHQPNLPPTFLTTFIRSDKTRKDTRVFVMLWDPRMIELHMQAGTVEPKSATGKAGPGYIPRTPDVMKRVVAASNAGFQALHGEFGMMADGVVYLPPKPYAATVMKLRDGSTAFGTWPNDATVPDHVVSFRQNLTVMVQDEQFNPYKRTWWGGAVPGAEDKTHTVRSGICLTRERFVAYFYGVDLSPEALSGAMIQARCSYSLALDMNAGHAGMEFYKVAPTGTLPELGRPLDFKWEAEGDVPDMDGWSFRSKRLIKGMGLMSFPRYIKREARDYFYLTLRYVLPGDNLRPVIDPPLSGEGSWELKGLPQHGFPYAIALSTIRPDKADPSTSFRVLQIDPRTVSAQRAAASGGAAKTVAVMDPGVDEGATSAWLDKNAFSIAASAPSKTALRVATGATSAGQGAGVVCVHDESGVLFYAELDGAAKGKRVDLAAISRLLSATGCTQQLAVKEPMNIALGDGTDLTRAEVHLPRGPSAVRLVRAVAPAGVRIFEDTPVVPFNEWYGLQSKRIRYFKKRD